MGFVSNWYGLDPVDQKDKRVKLIFWRVTEKAPPRVPCGRRGGVLGCFVTDWLFSSLGYWIFAPFSSTVAPSGVVVEV
jgi:hypothetical protein